MQLGELTFDKAFLLGFLMSVRFKHTSEMHGSVQLFIRKVG